LRESGLVLITALFMLTALIGVVLICSYPLVYEKKRAALHHDSLERWKCMERGAFGRLADQRGGKFNACGGYFSDTGMKVRRKQQGETGRMLEYWWFRKDSPSQDKYRYHSRYGFWVGYRGKRYIVKSPGEEHMRLTGHTFRGPYYGEPILVDGYQDRIDYMGYSRSMVHFSNPAGTAGEEGHPKRQYNPVDKLVVTLHPRRPTGTLSARLIFAEQRNDSASYRVDYERGEPEGANTFVFKWENPDPVCPGSAFQIGLKKLVVYEDGKPSLTRAICIPPAGKFRWDEEIYKNLYRIDVDFE
jgi:hypothetical protein